MKTKPKSDWQTLKPIAAKIYGEIAAKHGTQAGAVVEALEIARRQAEIHQTMMDWQERHRGKSGLETAGLLDASSNLFDSISDEFGHQRAVHILTAVEREHIRARWRADLIAWRMRGDLTVEAAAHELGLAVEDVEAIEAGTFSAGPEVMRLVRAALKIIRQGAGGMERK